MLLGASFNILSLFSFFMVNRNLVIIHQNSNNGGVELISLSNTGLTRVLYSSIAFMLPALQRVFC